MRFPRPLQPGDRIGVTSPSSGVAPRMQGRLDVALAALRDRGFDVVVGECMGADRVVSAPRGQRAAELTFMLVDPAIRAVVPPWGGELAIDLVDQLDWDALAAAEPTWLVGFSDMSTVLLPITLRLGWATLHGWNLMDTPFESPEGLLHWLDVAGSTTPFTQRSPGRYRSLGFYDYVGDPDVSTMELDSTGSWTVVGGGDLDVSGRLVGGCIETVSDLAGTAYGDVPAFGREHADEGLLVYLEAAEHGRTTSPGRCTGCGWPGGSSTPTRSWSGAPRRRASTTSASTTPSSTPWGCSGSRSCSTWRSGTRSPSSRWSTARSAASWWTASDARSPRPSGEAHPWTWSCQSAGTRPAGPGTGWSAGREVGGASGPPSTPTSRA